MSVSGENFLQIREQNWEPIYKDMPEMLQAAALDSML